MEFTEYELSLLVNVYRHGWNEADWIPHMLKDDWKILDNLVERGIVGEREDEYDELIVFIANDEAEKIVEKHLGVHGE